MYPRPWILFWFFVICCHLYLDYSLYQRWKGWSRGMKTGFAISRLKMPVVRIWLFEVFLQRQLFSLSVTRWLIHQCIFWGFICLTFLSLTKFILLLLSMISLDAGLHDFFSQRAGYPFTKLWGDFFGLILLAGCSGALARRFVFRPVQIVHDQTDMFLTVYLLFMTLSGFMLEGLRMAVSPSGLDRYAFIGRLFMPSHFGIASDTGVWLAWTWIIHAFSGAAILVYLPHSKLLHSLLAPLIIALNAAEEQGRKDMYWPKTKQYRPTK
jgi:nitrate reductase gamma subunit